MNLRRLKTGSLNPQDVTCGAKPRKAELSEIVCGDLLEGIARGVADSNRCIHEALTAAVGENRTRDCKIRIACWTHVFRGADEKKTHNQQTPDEVDPTHRPPPYTRQGHHSLLREFYSCAKGKPEKSCDAVRKICG